MKPRARSHAARGMAVPTSIVPMPSVRIDVGHYEVLGTSHGVEVLRRGRAWYLRIEGDERAKIGPFPSKRAALQFCQTSPEL